MMFFLVVLSFAAAVSAAEVRFTSKGAFLVLPPSQENSTSTTPVPRNDDKENLEAVNERIMERLRQEFGSERGVYHVYLPDGRLQRVQYTAAPIKSQGPQQQGTSQDQAVPNVLNSNAYYVQVPVSRVQALVASQQTRNQEAQLQTPHQEQQARSSAAYSQPLEVNAQFQARTSAAYSQPLEVDAQFVPLQIVTPDQLAQYRSQF